MNLQINQIYHGFRLTQQEHLPEIESEGFLFLHEKSGARLCYIQSEDTNKVFSISFKTPPDNDCGTPHILEHSVLCGSRKYQAKDPFNELAKGSLNTFLNAMTYADKTMYPIASCNEKDFLNMMDVYLDAVFYPNIYNKKGIFLQEGWRYEKQGDDIGATGVVFNEMKGALSDPESRLANCIAQSIFGKTTYGFESGGDPQAIIDLTYDAFLDFHKKYYHPSNAYLYLYGDMDVMHCLEQIDTEYLSHFTVSQDLPIITETKVNASDTWIQGYYPEDSSENEKGYFAYNFKVGKCTEPKKILAMQLIGYLLLETNASPLKNALRNAELCEEAEGFFDSSTYEMIYSIIAKKVKAEDAEKFIEIVENVLQDIVEHGFDQELLDGGIKKLEFLLREEDYGSRPKGLVYHTRMMKSWLHGEDPFLSFHQLKLFTELKEDIKTGYLQKFMQEVFFNNMEKTKIIFLPDSTLQKKEKEKLSAKIADHLQNMGDQKDSILLQDQKALDEFQNTKDTPEILAQIPVLSLSDIGRTPQQYVHSKKTIDGMTYEFLPLKSNGIAYCQILFHAEHLPKELVPYSGLLADILGKIDTKETDFSSLPKKIDKIFGGFAVSNDVYTVNQTKYHSLLALNFKIMASDIQDAFAFLEEILFSSDYTAEKSLYKIVQSLKLQKEYRLQNYAHTAAILRSRGAVAAGAAIKEQNSGIAYYQFICEIEKLLQTEPKTVWNHLRKTAEMIFQKQYMTAVIGCEEHDLPTLETQMAHLMQQLPENEKQAIQHPSYSPRKEGYCIPSAVQYNIKTWDMTELHQTYTGKLQVLKTILTSEYLWNQIRVQGGAYGCGCNFQKNGGIYFYSYRDPNVQRTYDIYAHLADQIAEFQADEREMTKYIIGSINNFDQPKTHADQMDVVANMVFTGITDEMRQKERLEMLETTATDIREMAEFLKALSERENICTIGGSDAIQKDANLFDQIQNLIS